MRLAAFLRYGIRIIIGDGKDFIRFRYNLGETVNTPSFFIELAENLSPFRMIPIG